MDLMQLNSLAPVITPAAILNQPILADKTTWFSRHKAPLFLINFMKTKRGY